MSADTEIELKLRYTDARIWDMITKDPIIQKLAVPGSMQLEKLETVYYDTSSYALKKRRIAYRIRQRGSEWIATVKAGGTSGGGLHERKEWSVVINGPEPDIGPFSNTPLGSIMQEAVGQEILTVLFKTSFQRKSMILKMPEGGEVEFCSDKGVILANGKMKPLQEIELELKGAKPAAAMKLGAALARKYPLLPEPRSKYYQGLKLAGLEVWEEDKNNSNTLPDLLHIFEDEQTRLCEIDVLKEKIKRGLFTPLLLETCAWCLEMMEVKR